ncbi:hypothetical protein Tco_0603656 [Tanacetum coccineum]
MHVFVGNFTYIVDFIIIEDISSIIDHRLLQVVIGKPFVKISNMTDDSPEGVVRFTNETDEVAYKMPHMIEQYNSLLDLEKEHTKSVYLRNEEDKRRGVELYLTRKSLEVLRKFHLTTLGGRFNQLSHKSLTITTSPTLNVPPTTEPNTPPTTVHDQAEDAHFEPYKYINPFCTLVQEATKSFSCNVDTSNMHKFYQRHRSDYHWTKDHPLEQVCRNSSKPVHTRRQLSIDAEMCMFAITVSTAESTNIKEEMADHTWIEAIQEELHQFD